MSRLSPAIAALALASASCSAYQRTYDQEYQRLEQQSAAQQVEDAAAHAEAQQYAAVVYFETGSADLDADAARQLRWFVEKMSPYPKANFDVQGFADSTGSEARNQALSVERAQAVSAFLQGQGIAPARIYATGFSTQSPAASNATTQGRRSNRRVEVTVR